MSALKSDGPGFRSQICHFHSLGKFHAHFQSWFSHLWMVLSTLPLAVSLQGQFTSHVKCQIRCLTQEIMNDTCIISFPFSLIVMDRDLQIAAREPPRPQRERSLLSPPDSSAKGSEAWQPSLRTHGLWDELGLVSQPSSSFSLLEAV